MLVFGSIVRPAHYQVHINSINYQGLLYTWYNIIYIYIYLYISSILVFYMRFAISRTTEQSADCLLRAPGMGVRVLSL